MESETLPVLSVSQFIDLFNSSLELIYPEVEISGEVSSIRVSQQKWLYFDLKDEAASLKFFGTVWQLPTPIEDGMRLIVKGRPRLSNRYGFSVNIDSIKLAGEGTLKRAAELLLAKLKSEGLFDSARKRPLPHPPQRIGLITSSQAAAYSDFLNVLADRFGGLNIELIDVAVQGDQAPGQIVAAIEQFNELAQPPDVLVIIRGGGSIEDLAAFSSEAVTRAVAASRVPTLVAIGHDRDVSLAELAADKRMPTPSMAAECLAPSRKVERGWLSSALAHLETNARLKLKHQRDHLSTMRTSLISSVEAYLTSAQRQIESNRQVLNAYSPVAVLKRGYAVVRYKGRVVKQAKALHPGDLLDVTLRDGQLAASVKDVRIN